MSNEMSKSEAVEYLERKGKIQESEEKKPKYTKAEKKLIAKVVKEGKIFGDPLAIIKD